MADQGFWTHARRNPDALALVDPSGREWTRGELHAECNRIVHGLRALGLEHAELTGPVERLRSSFLGGVKHVPIRYRLRPSA